MIRICIDKHQPLYRCLSGTAFLLGMAVSASAQRTSQRDASQRDASQRDPMRADTARLVTASFTQPSRPQNPAFSRTLGGCISLFERALSTYNYDHPHDFTPAHDTLSKEARRWIPYPSAAIAAGRSCYREVYHAPSEVADADVPSLWPFVLAVNEDAFARDVMTRWLDRVGSDSVARAALLAKAVHQLLLNSELSGGGVHLTDAHVAMAREYLTALRTMGPSHVLAWLNGRADFEDAGGWRLDNDANIQAAIDDDKQALTIMDAVAPSALSVADFRTLQERVAVTRTYGVQRLIYLKTLDHADLKRFAQLVDSTWPGGKRPWLVGTPAPPLAADYWFGTSSNVAPAAVPASNAVSLIAFIGPRPGEPAMRNPDKDALLRQLHAKYPALQIILMTATTGVWANESLLDHPEREAQLMYHYVHDSLHVPGIMGVVAGKQQAVTPDGQMFPVQLPLFDRYIVDVSHLSGHMFLVDRDGTVVDEGMSLDVLVPRLLAAKAR